MGITRDWRGITCDWRNSELWKFEKKNITLVCQECQKILCKIAQMVINDSTILVCYTQIEVIKNLHIPTNYKAYQARAGKINFAFQWLRR